MSLIGKNIGNYRIIAKIGEGGMGLVFLGEHPQLGRRVAVKVLHEELTAKEEMVARFFTEAKAVNDIGHPNIVDIMDFGRTKDEDTGGEVIYFVMEFLDGEGLSARLKREGVTVKDAIAITDQCASALAASHAKNIVHRDLKPDNIFLVTREGSRNFAKLLDFGIAKLTGDQAGAQQHKTRTGLVMGTPSYMSPEQCDGRGLIDWRADVYSLGIVLYEMLTGRVPFPGDGFGEVIVGHLSRPPPPPRSICNDLSPAIESVVLHAIEKKKENRFQSMDELRWALSDPEAHLAAYGSGPTATSTIASTKVPTMVGAAVKPAAKPASAEDSEDGKTIVDPGFKGEAKPTTLTGASGEVSGGEAGRKGRLPLVLGAAALVVAGIGVGGWFLVRRPHAATQQPAAVAPPPPVVDEVTVTIDSTPRGARLYRAGRPEPIGLTPHNLKAKRNLADFDVVLRMDGYRDEIKTITTGRDHDMLVALTKNAPPPPPVAPPPPKPATPSGKTAAKGTKPPTPAPGTPAKGGTKAPDRDGVIEPSF